MKKLLSLATIVAIVVTTFAFTTKKFSSYCVLNAAGNACVVAFPLMISPFGNNFNYWPGYVNEVQTPCAQASPFTDCITAVKLKIE